SSLYFYPSLFFSAVARHRSRPTHRPHLTHAMHVRRDSYGTVVPADAEMLEQLDLSLKGFADVEVSPTSATMSLPTPPAGRLPSLANEAPNVPFAFPDDSDIVVPGAPLVKDMDSFTEGTAPGDFEFLGDEPEVQLPLNAPSLDTLPPPSDTASAIERWRWDVDQSTPEAVDDVSMFGQVAEIALLPQACLPMPEIVSFEAIPTTAKRPRPRSLSSDDGGEGDAAPRRCRVRPSTPPSASPRARAQSCSSASSGLRRCSFLRVDLGPPPDMLQFPRPPSRALSAPPD
ncbi:unnamed protein product, partial [Mycena citricolor]